MSKTDIIKCFYEILKHVSRDNASRYMKNHHNKEFSKLMELTKFLDKFDVANDKNKRISIFERIYCLEHNLNDRPKCHHCKTEYVCSFNKQKNEYRKWCSPECQASDLICIDKSKNTRKKKYGDENYNGIDKSKNTRFEKYGSWHNKDFVKKIKNIKHERYGDENFVNTEKMMVTKLKRYGDKNYNNTEKNKLTRKRNFYNEVLMKDKNLTPLFSENEYVNSDKNTIFKWKCNKCGNIFESKFNYNFKCLIDNTYRVRCYTCFPRIENQTSEKENELADFISKNIDTVVMRSNRTIISPYELDVYLPDLKLAFEFDGLYWHSEENGKDERYHLFKTEECEKHGIKLIHIFEDEWDNKKDIIKSRILNILGKYNKTIYARKCIVKEITSKTSSEFICQSHIQGKCKSSYNLGLYYNNELVSVMTFGKSRFNKNYEWELLRLCSKNGYHVIGGAGKLLKFFEEKKNPNSLISYADRRWSNGNVYYKTGFTLYGSSKPNYWYVDKDFKKRYSRMLFQKHKLKNVLDEYFENKSEYENMKINGFTKIYDCGNLIFIKIYKKDQH